MAEMVRVTWLRRQRRGGETLSVSNIDPESLLIGSSSVDIAKERTTVPGVL